MSDSGAAGEPRRIDIRQQELSAIAERRSIDQATAKDGLVGLALSGGGIRSATFALGVLEGLKKFDLLKEVDYLSTVSGGGYIGAWLSANCVRARNVAPSPVSDATTNPGEYLADTWHRLRGLPHEPQTNAAADAADKTPPPDPKRDWLSHTADWSTSIAHLRRYSNYLSPSLGFFSADTWTMVTVWLRNTLLIQAMVVLGIAALLLAPRLIYQTIFFQWPNLGSWRWLSVALFILSVVGVAGSQRQLLADSATASEISPTAAANVSWFHRRNWLVGTLLGSLFFAAALVVIIAFDYRPFENRDDRVQVALAVTILLLFAGVSWMPAAVAVLNRLQALKAKIVGRVALADSLDQVNYTQGWAQALIVVPMMITAILVSSILWSRSDIAHPTTLGRLDTYQEFFLQAWRYWPLPLCVAFCSLLLLAYCSVRRCTSKTERFNSLFVVVLATAAGMLVLHALLCAIMLLIHGWAVAHDEAQSAWLAFVWTPGLLLVAFALAINVLIGILGRASAEGVREWWSRLAAWILIYGIGWTAILFAAVFGPLWIERIGLSGGWHGISIGWVLTTVGGLIAGNSSDTSGAAANGAKQKSKSQQALEIFTVVAPFIFIAGLLLAVSFGVHMLLVKLSTAFTSVESTFSRTLFDLRDQHWMLVSQVSTSSLVAVLLVLILCLGLLALRVDINEFSLNAFYRNRLVRCYLGASRPPKERKPQHFTGFDESDDLAMEALQNTTGLLHVVNCALNLGGSHDLALHTRHSASFTITPFALGSYYQTAVAPGERVPIGFAATSDIKDGANKTTLGQAISVSGAAASPNQGFHTAPAVAFVLTVFNARLGWWFPNPLFKLKSPSPRSSLKYLLKELFGFANEQGKFLMISDGGHFENLGVYELIRRECKVIIASDAECDADLQFEGLGKLIRMCDVDLQTKIEIAVSAIRPDLQTGWSKGRCAVGKIRYASGKEGTLIYIKASMTGREDTAILQYKATHARFPHESTGNQFYGEDQFESYRRLGGEIVTQLLKGVAPPAEAKQPATLPSRLNPWIAHAQTLTTTCPSSDL
jgi:hypothetical protein